MCHLLRFLRELDRPESPLEACPESPVEAGDCSESLSAALLWEPGVFVLHVHNTNCESAAVWDFHYEWTKSALGRYIWAII